MALKILVVSVEVAPFAKVGGLADVASSLPKALRKLGHDARIIMPAYPIAVGNAPTPPKTVLNDFKVSINNWWHKHAQLTQTTHDDVPVWMVGTDEWFNEVHASESVYALGVDAYLFFARAVLQACKQMNWIPDVIHCNDWHTGFIPVLMRESESGFWDETGAVFTIHNLAYQGEFGPEVLDKAGLSRELFNLHQLEAFGSVNFLKSGCVMSDFVNTVSETYSHEIRSGEFGCRLEGLMSHLAAQGKLSGILNGIDVDEWNPATDMRIAAHYDADHPANKAKCREALFNEIGLHPIPGVPIAGMVSRLSEQKGMDLIVAAAEKIRDLPMQFVVQGLGDPWLADKFDELSKKFPNHFRFAQRFDVQLAQHIYSGADLFLMPSAFEPCGLGQLIAMRYGTIPVVRRTGGLADTVFEGKNGFVLQNKSSEELLLALKRASDLYGNQREWAALVQRAMREDHSWSASALKYVAVYRKSLEGRRLAESLAS